MTRRDFIRACVGGALAVAGVSASHAYQRTTMRCDICGSDIPINDVYVFLRCPGCGELWGNPHPKIEASMARLRAIEEARHGTNTKRREGLGL
jgi:hypothetical protein